MINAAQLLQNLKGLMTRLEMDIRQRVQEVSEEESRLKVEHQEALNAGRTAQTFESWRDDAVTQSAAAWILACVFIRFIEDNRLIEQPVLSGPGERRNMARDRHTLYFQQNPTQTDREYLWSVFHEIARLQAMNDLFDERFNPLWKLEVSGDGAGELLEFWQKIDPESGALIHDFTDSDWNTRFLGDLYQDLSENIRKKYALLQTPEFVEIFILDRTLTPAIEEFGFSEVRLIDPTCGSGHFLLGAFERLFALWQRENPEIHSRELAQRALNGVYGVDINPYAVAIARFRLLVVALKSCGIQKMADAPGFKINLAAGDSLLLGPLFRRGLARIQMNLNPDEDPLRQAYETEDKESLKKILCQQYHAVVGNPPYIRTKDNALNQGYRDRFSTCHREYSLGVPFTERFFDLCLSENTESNSPAGYMGMITTNSFMKREFGKKLIEDFFPHIDLTHVIDTSGAYIPSHNTPTVILLGRHRLPVISQVCTVQGIRGEPGTPDNPAQGKVWSSIINLVDKPGAENDFISVVDTSRETFSKHPWSIGGGGATVLKEFLESSSSILLSQIIQQVGFLGMTHADEIMVAPLNSFQRKGVEQKVIIRIIAGDQIRDWMLNEGEAVSFPYINQQVEEISNYPGLYHWLWFGRTILGNRATFSKQTYFQEGRPWWEWHQVALNRLTPPLSIVYTEIATHNHFLLDRGGKVFKQTAPIIKLRHNASSEDHLKLVGLLNSSTACFWMKQVMHNKDATGFDPERFRFVFNATKLKQFPIPEQKPLHLATLLDQLAQERQKHLPSSLKDRLPLSRDQLNQEKKTAESLLHRMIVLQEELDWQCYQFYGVSNEAMTFLEEPPEIKLGERAFEIVLARNIEQGESNSAWFENHNSTPITEIPSYWPTDYKELVKKRIQTIEENRNIRLIERPEYKRRWNLESWESQEERALQEWLLDHLEHLSIWNGEVSELISCSRLADLVTTDTDFMKVAELYRGRADFDVTALVAELVADQSVPFLPVLRYKDSGLRKRKDWEHTWELQRQEDAIDARTQLLETEPNHLSEKQATELKKKEIGTIPVPPRYTSGDFKKANWWRLRGKLDVPKERFVSYPFCSKEVDPTLMVAWAGWNHLRQAQALAGWYLLMKDNEGWSVERLTPLLAGLQELLPWLKQWHNEIDPTYGMSMGDYFEGFIQEESRALGVPPETIREWQPPQTNSRSRNN